MDFNTFNLHPGIMEGIRKLGYSEPTPIQAQAIPPIMQGRDVIGLAQTGTGKTAAFILPILQRLLSRPHNGVRALVVSPTRELAEQTCEAFNQLGAAIDLKTIAVYGGVNMDLQTSRLRNGVDIVVACPGRLLDHLWKGNVSLAGLEVLVIDEVDRMFDMGFLPDIHSILDCIMHGRQTLMFSATLPPDISRLAHEVLHDPVTVQIGRTLPAETVSHALYPVKPHLKTALLKEILKQTKTDSVLVFTRTKQRAEQLARQLARSGFRVASLQGDMPQLQRQEAMDGFRDGYYKILVATDIAARGLDVTRISHVINFDMPQSTDDYIHRIGRTGRVNRSGDALTFITTADAGKTKALERIFGQPLERRMLDGFDYSRPAGDGEAERPTRRPRRRYSKRATAS